MRDGKDSRLWRRDDRNAVLWAVACCWLAVGGNYLLLEFGFGAKVLVPVDLFAVPLLATAGAWLIGRWRRT